MAQGKFVVQGMNRAEDAVMVERVLSQVNGMQGLEIQQDTAEVSFTYDEGAASYMEIKDAVLDVGYGVLDTEDNPR